MDNSCCGSYCDPFLDPRKETAVALGKRAVVLRLTATRTLSNQSRRHRDRNPAVQQHRTPSWALDQRLAECCEARKQRLRRLTMGCCFYLVCISFGWGLVRNINFLRFLACPFPSSADWLCTSSLLGNPLQRNQYPWGCGAP